MFKVHRATLYRALRTVPSAPARGPLKRLRRPAMAPTSVRMTREWHPRGIRKMDAAWQQRVRERAYAIWQREGSPDGSAEQFWLMAEEELLAEGQGPASGPAEERPDRPRDEAQLDDTIDVFSFPASDPPAWTSETGAGAPKGGQEAQAVLMAGGAAGHAPPRTAMHVEGTGRR